MGEGTECHTPDSLPPGKTPGTHCTGGWVDPRSGMDRCGKFAPTWIQLVFGSVRRKQYENINCCENTCVREGHAC